MSGGEDCGDGGVVVVKDTVDVVMEAVVCIVMIVVMM